jgi:large subunit ribosomal protein L21
MYAVIEDSGTQIKVAPGDIIKVDPRDLPEEQIELTFDRVMLVGGDDQPARIGAPLVAGAKVVGDILEEGRDEKIDIWKFRRRKNYVRHKGHRQPFLRVKITAITG